MTDKSDCLKNLQQALEMELSAVTQYMLHALTADDWGLDKLASKMREEMQEELGHAESFAERIVFLGGDPQMKPAKVAGRAQSLKDLFAADLEDEKEAISFYTRASRDAMDAGDIGTQRLFENNALDEEGHMSWLELQLSLLDRMGEPAYIAMQINDMNAD
ncbi:bacterioferritin [Pseudoruegeria sp. HB172150]|uniref:bacterioferritin n=1 Tax=Pseudoruegeria sp. HB172150 TaxID=2721164 RepID=UPI001554F2C3|nr:bacterioferritin [Pseudoruegeria sp. HB172150]